MIPSLVEIRLPDWAAALAETAAPMPDVVARMRFVVAASRENVARGAALLSAPAAAAGALGSDGEAQPAAINAAALSEPAPTINARRER